MLVRDMSSSFSSHDGTCEGRGCQNEMSATYMVNERRDLCQCCARVQLQEGAILREVGHQITCYCVKHEGQPAVLFCASHGIPVCQPCALAEHQICTLLVIEDATKKMRKRLRDLYLKAMDKTEELRRLDAEQNMTRRNIEAHLQQQTDAITECAVEMRKNIQYIYDDKAKRINQEAENEMRNVKATRDARLKQNAKELAMHQEKQDAEFSELVSRLDQAKKNIQATLQELKRNCEQLCAAVKAVQFSEKLLFDVVRILRDGLTAEELLLDVLRVSVSPMPLDSVASLAKNIVFVKGDTTTTNHLNGCNERTWYLTSTVDLPPDMKAPRVRIVNDTLVTLLDAQRHALYTMNLESKVVKKISDDIADVVRLGKDQIACVDFGRTCISLYSVSWENARAIAISDKHTEGLKHAKIAVDSNGKLLVKLHPRTIYIFDPQTGKEEGSIYVRVKHIHDMIGLSNGDIVIKIRRNKFLVIDGKGNKSQEIMGDDWAEANLAVNRTANTLHAVYVDNVLNKVGVHSNLRTNTVTGRESDTIAYPPGMDLDRVPHCDMFDAKRMCICSDHILHIFGMETIDMSTTT